MYTDTSYKSTGPGFDTGKDFEAMPDVKKPTEVGFMGLFRGFLGRTGASKHAQGITDPERISFTGLVPSIPSIKVSIHGS